jgi:hypothetical protein
MLSSVRRLARGRALRSLATIASFKFKGPTLRQVGPPCKAIIPANSDGDQGRSALGPCQVGSRVRLFIPYDRDVRGRAAPLSAGGVGMAKSARVKFQRCRCAIE